MRINAAENLADQCCRKTWRIKAAEKLGGSRLQKNLANQGFRKLGESILVVFEWSHSLLQFNFKVEKIEFKCKRKVLPSAIICICKMYDISVVGL